MKPSCWLPTARFSQRDIARPAVSGPSCASSSVSLDALEQDAEGRQVEVDPLEPVDDRRRLERLRQRRADLLGHDRLDRAAGWRDRTPRPRRAAAPEIGAAADAEPAMGDLADRLPVDEPRARRGA